MCCVATSDPRCFLPVTMYGTTHAHLVHMCWPLLWGLLLGQCNTPRACHANRACATIQSVLFSYPEVLYRSFGSSITFVLDETHWHRINAKFAPHVFSLLASVEGTTVCLEIPLQSPPPPGHRHLVTVSPPHPGDRRALPRDFARGGGG